MAKIDINHEENIKSGKYSNSEILKLADEGKIDLQQLFLTEVLTPEKFDELQKIRLYTSISKPEVSFEEKWELIDEYGLDVEDLYQKRVLRSSEYQKMKPLPEVDFPSDVWEKVPNVQPNRTDVFVVGGVSSGKTCFLAGLLEHGQKAGNLFVDHMINPGGGIYEDLLRGAVEEGRLFKATPTDAIQYICADLKEEERSSPVNIFDMSGEIFQFCFAKSKVEITELYPNFIEFIFNDNPKVFFLALNWKVARMQMRNQKGEEFNVSQSGLLNNILEFLVHHKLIKKTKAICLLVTQWDEYPDPKNPNPTDEGLDDFIADHYLQLFNRLMEYERTYGVKFKILPFSLGEFDRKNAYKFDPSYAKKIAEFLIRTVPFVKEKKTGFIDNIFKKD